MKEPTVRKSTIRYALLVVVGAIAIAGAAAWLYDAPQPIEEKFAQLNSAGTNLCSGSEFISEKDGAQRLQGACCGNMDFHRYVEQLEGLKAFSDISEIPQDPYDISVEHANRLLDYQRTLTLSAEQQRIYDEATRLSHEGGPCCCKCWRWYAFEGLAKYLIIEHDFSAEQVAQVWDLEDGCGGPGHEHA